MSTPSPYPIITFTNRLCWNYGTDKPDLRNPLSYYRCEQISSQRLYLQTVPQKRRFVPSKCMQILSKGFHEKLLKFAQSIGMGGLGYLEVKEDKTYKGPIDKFIPDDMKGEIAEIANLATGRYHFLHCR